MEVNYFYVAHILIRTDIAICDTVNRVKLASCYA